MDGWMDNFKHKWKWANSHVRWIGSVNRMGLLLFFLSFFFDRLTNIWNALISLNLVDYGPMFYRCNLFNFRCSHAINGKEWAWMQREIDQRLARLGRKSYDFFFHFFVDREKVALILEAVYLTFHWSVSSSGTGPAGL